MLDGQVDGVAELACPDRVGCVGANPGEPTERHAHEEVVADFSAEVDALQQELPRAFRVSHHAARRRSGTGPCSTLTDSRDRSRAAWPPPRRGSPPRSCSPRRTNRQYSCSPCTARMDPRSPVRPLWRRRALPTTSASFPRKRVSSREGKTTPTPRRASARDGDPREHRVRRRQPGRGAGDRSPDSQGQREPAGGPALRLSRAPRLRVGRAGIRHFGTSAAPL